MEFSIYVFDVGENQISCLDSSIHIDDLFHMNSTHEIQMK